MKTKTIHSADLLEFLRQQICPNERVVGKEKSTLICLDLCMSLSRAKKAVKMISKTWSKVTRIETGDTLILSDGSVVDNRLQNKILVFHG